MMMAKVVLGGSFGEIKMSALSIEFKSKTYVTKDFEFIYMDHYPVKRGLFYKIIYTKDKKEVYLGLNGQRLIPQKRFVKPSLFTQYKRAKGSIQRENYLKSFSYQLTDKQKEKNSFPRYFAQYVFDKKGNIFEIRKLDYQKITPLYKKVSMSWFIKGDKERVKEQNEFSLKLANGQLSGMWDYLDPLQYYIESTPKTKYEKVQEKLSRLKQY
tara:strand:+ start:6591 stop:7226 length:636 start_codon:yes stop_codon:yes gene_type:complete